MKNNSKCFVCVNVQERHQVLTVLFYFLARPVFFQRETRGLVFGLFFGGNDLVTFSKAWKIVVQVFLERVDYVGDYRLLSRRCRQFHGSCIWVKVRRRNEGNEKNNIYQYNDSGETCQFCWHCET